MDNKKMLSGIGGSPGVSNGAVFKFIEIPIVISDTVGTAEEELANLYRGVDHATRDLDKLSVLYAAAAQRHTTTDGSNSTMVSIFAAHIEILNDEVVMGEVKGKIKSGSSAAQAVKDIFSGYITTFQALEDEYFKERSIDIEDVMKRILRRILNIKLNDLGCIDKPSIILAKDITPSDTIQLNPRFVMGMICEQGGPVSHAAILARFLGIPMVVGVVDALKIIPNNAKILYINGTTGCIEWDPSPERQNNWNKEEQEFKQYKEQLNEYKDKPSVSADGQEMLIEANIGSPVDIKQANEVGAQGVGLFRTEFLYMNANSFPNEEAQFNNYKEAVIVNNKKSLVVRTLDIGGDKTLDYYKFKKEGNPFLGVRAIRWCLKNQKVLREQIRALLRASAFGDIGIMIPMISTVNEFLEVRGIIEEEKVNLKNKKIAFADKIPVGMMIEVPAAAIIADRLAKYSDFFSIGTNDLIQYSMAADRTNEQVGYLYQPLNPAILKLINLTVRGAHKHNKSVAICGEAAAQLNALPIWLGLGIDALSMSALAILPVRKYLSQINSVEAKRVAKLALECDTQEEVIQLLHSNFSNE